MGYPNWLILCPTFINTKYPVGEDEGQEQIGATSPGHHQRVRDEGGWENKGGDPGVEPDQYQTLGCFTQEFHSGQFLLQIQATWLQLDRGSTLTGQVSTQCHCALVNKMTEWFWAVTLLHVP